MKNLPQKFLDEMKVLFKEDYNKFIDTYNNPSFYGLRANTLKISKLELKAITEFLGEEIPWSQDGFYYDINQRPAKSSLYHAGLYYIQEPSAMAVVNSIDIQPGMKVLDICAAPGGKTINIASKLKGEGLLVSNDINNQRTKAILKNIEFFGVSNALITNENHNKLKESFPEFFDRIILDAPCSGEGMFRKDGDLIKSWERSVTETIPIQKELLDACALMLKPDGVMIYSTCTFNEDENEKQILDFLVRNSNFMCIEVPKDNGMISRDILPCSARLLPHEINGEGHFLCLLKKISTNNPSNEFKAVSENITRSKIHFNRDNLPYQYLDFEHDNLNIELNGRFIISDNKLYKEIYTDKFIKGFKIIRNGLFVGEIKREQFIPSQAFIMTLSKSDFKKYLDFDQNDSQIIKYLKGETIFVDEEEDGFYAVGVNGYLLGYGKLNNGKLKNGYNKNWRMT